MSHTPTTQQVNDFLFPEAFISHAKTFNFVI